MVKSCWFRRLEDLALTYLLLSNNCKKSVMNFDGKKSFVNFVSNLWLLCSGNIAYLIPKATPHLCYEDVLSII